MLNILGWKSIYCVYSNFIPYWSQGRIIWSGASFEGRLSDNAIMELIINEKIPEAAELVAFLKNNKE